VLAERNQYARIEKTELRSWTFHDVLSHKQLIEAQERKANGGQIPEHLKANQERIARMKKQFKDYKGSDEFDNGYRDGTSYNHETDPFYMEEQS
jgi:hypothetical protein